MITSINKETKEKFLSVFEIVNENHGLINYQNILRKAYQEETFKLLYRFFGRSNPEIKDIIDQAKEITKSFAKRKLRRGFRSTKGFLEDIVAFMVFDQNPNFESTINDSPAKYRDYIFEHSSDFFYDEDIGELKELLKQVYSFVAKIDHTTSIKNYVAGIENQKAYKGLEKMHADIAPTLLLILVKYGYHKTNRLDEDADFIYKLWFVSKYFSSIIAIYELIQDTTAIDDNKYFKSDADKRYIAQQKQSLDEITADISNSELNNQEVLNQMIKDVQDELVKRGYISTTPTIKK